MERELLTTRQGICILTLFLFGSTSIMGMGSDVNQDVWISFLLASISAIPFMLLYARMSSLYPEKDFWGLIEALLHPAIAKSVIALMVWYSMHLCSLVLRNFSQFVEACVMPETPQLPILLMMILIVVYMLKSGINTMGNWAIITLPVTYSIIVLTVLLSINKMDLTHIQPVMSHSIGDIVKSSYPYLSFPYLEGIVFVCAVSGFKKNGSPYKVYLYALLLSATALLAIYLRNLFLLGPQLLGSEYFPSYIAVKVIQLGEIISRLEGSISMNYIIGGIVKISICLLAAAKGLSHLFALRGYQQALMPLGLLAVALSTTLFKSTVEMYAFIEHYEYYAIPFQLIIPLIIWLLAERQAHKIQQKDAAESPA